MKLSNLILAVGDENITVQNLAESSPVVNVKRRYAEVTFLTSAEAALGIFPDGCEAKYMALVIWMPREMVDAAQKQTA